MRISRENRGTFRSELGFPEFESSHLANFSTKAQFSKSVASTIPPRPQVSLDFEINLKAQSPI